jgi:hypothetical protein
MLLASFGCGDPLVDDSYQGKRIASLTCNVIEESAHYEHARAALFWSSDLTDSTLATLHEARSTSRAISSGSPYQLNLFEPPDEAYLFAWDKAHPDGPRAAIGRILVYDDANDNGKKDESEGWAGANFPYALLYAPEPLPGRTGLTREALPVGLHVLFLPLPCGQWLDPLPERACASDVPLLQACDSDAACQGGTCVTRFLFPWPLGACLVPARAESCDPQDGALLRGGPDMTYWSKSCASDEDCPRGDPYVCDLGAGACMPRDPPLVTIAASDDLSHLPPICAGDGSMMK